jgi:superoxide dismutase, Cu-Zn family
MRTSTIVSLLAAFALFVGASHADEDAERAQQADDLEEGEVEDGQHADLDFHASPPPPEGTPPPGGEQPAEGHRPDAAQRPAPGQQPAPAQRPAPAQQPAPAQRPAPAQQPATGARAAAPGRTAGASADFVDRDGKSVGKATLTESPHGVLIHLELRGLQPGAKAIHIHSVGTCDDRQEGFVASGGHLNPDGKEHGLFNPAGPDAGDLPNIHVGTQGNFEAEFFTTLASLEGADGRARILDQDGAALVIHTNRDDHITQPIGGAGARIACGVIQKSE